MRPGQMVLYRNGGTYRTALVAAVVGAGASGAKRLDLSFGASAPDVGLTVLNVPHEADAGDGDHAWAPYDARRVTADPSPIIGARFTPPIERADDTVSLDEDDGN